MGVSEEIRQKLLPRFRETTADRVEKISTALLELERGAAAPDAGEELARELHTLKGEARMMGFVGISTVVHAAEDLLKAVARDGAPGDRLEVFVCRDSEDRLVASTETPLATVGEVATLKVVSVNHHIGAFLAWGLAKDLLLPFREQTGPVRVGQDVVVRVYLDEKTERIVASMKLGAAVVVRSPGLPDTRLATAAPLG